MFVFSEAREIKRSSITRCTKHTGKIRCFQPEKLTIKNLLAGLNFNLKLQNTSFEMVSSLDQIFTGNYSSKTKQGLLRHPHISANIVNHLAAYKHLFHVRGNVPDDFGIWWKRLLNSIILKTLAVQANSKLAGPKIWFLLKYYFLLLELKCFRAPAYTCSLQDQLARSFTDKTIHCGAPP